MGGKFQPISWMPEDDSLGAPMQTASVCPSSVTTFWDSAKGVVSALTSGVCFAFVALLFVVLGDCGIPHLQIIFIADLGMTIALIPPIIYYRVSLLTKSIKDLAVLTSIGIIWTAGYVALLNSLSRIPMGNMIAIIHGTMPVVTPVLALIVLKETWHGVDVIGTLINLTGIVLVTQPTFIFGRQEETPDTLYPIGYFYAILSAVAFSTICILARYICKHVSLLMLSFYKVCIGAAFALFLALIFEPPVWQPEWKVILYFIAMIIFNTIGTYLRFRSLQLVAAATVVLLANIQLVIAYILDFIVFKEKPTPIDLTGACFIILSATLVAAYTWRRNMTDRTSETEDEGNDFLVVDDD
ncbi:S-adenosylmethionine uptake transporter-like [Glandiceps talaboti]